MSHHFHQIVNLYDCIPVRQKFSIKDKKWQQTANEKIRSDPHSMDTESIKVEHSEIGSLVVWAKMKSDVFKDDQTFDEAVKELVHKMIKKCPIDFEEETTLDIQVDKVPKTEGKTSN